MTTVTLASTVLSSLNSLATQTASSSSNSSTASHATGSGLQIQTQTPIFSCVPASYNWTGGTPPYLLYIIQSGQINATVLKTLPAEAAPGTASWGCDIQAGTSLTFVVQDNKGLQQYSTPIVMELGNTSCLPSTGSSNHVGAIVGGVVGGVCGLAIVSLLVWFFIIRPARKSKSRGAGFYEPQDADGMKEVATVESSRPSVVGQSSGPGVGTYNLQDVDFNEQSLDHLRENTAGPPSYDNAASPRRVPPDE